MLIEVVTLISTAITAYALCAITCLGVIVVFLVFVFTRCEVTTTAGPGGSDSRRRAVLTWKVGFAQFTLAVPFGDHTRHPGA